MQILTRTAYLLFLIAEVWIGFYLVWPFLLWVIYSLKKWTGSLFSIHSRKPLLTKTFDFAAVITAHKDTRLIMPLVDSLCRQGHPLFHVYVVADACDISQLRINDSRVTVIKPPTDLNSKVRSIDMAVRNFIRDHDAMIIFDSDNLAHPSFLQVLNQYFKLGYRAVQTNMQPKNTDTLFAKLDTIGDIYYNFTDREMRMELGLSSAIWGLGIAMETELYKKIVYQHFLGGFDKRLQADLITNIPRLAFAKEAIVYDEKISDPQSLETQRTRWLNAQFKYMKLAFDVFASGIKKLDLNITYFGFMNVRPPLFMIVGMGGLFAILNLFINPFYSLIWAGIILLFIVSFFLIVVTKSRDPKIYRAVFSMPLFVLRQVSALFKIGRANKSFLKTEHTKVVYIQDLLKNEPV